MSSVPNLSLLGQVGACVQNTKTFANESLSKYEPVVLVSGSLITTACALWLWEFLNQEECLTTRVKKAFFKVLKKVPKIREKIDEEMKKTKVELEDGMLKDFEGMSFVQRLPQKGWTEEEILNTSKELVALGRFDWMHGRASGAVYNYTKTLSELTSKVYAMASYTNPLHSDIFPGVRKMEAEVVRMTCNLFNGDDKSCGVMTSGGTESILLACKAYRDRALENGVKTPEIVCPITAHAAFDKAAKLMRMRIRHIRIDPVTLKVDLKAMQKTISKNTCMLVGSAPNFPHGIVDDILEISKLGVKYHIPVHVDGCLGGFLLPFMDKAGFPLPPFDFRLPGVTSISADTHKYGSAPKGSSVILYRNANYRRYQYYVHADWPGGIYASSAMPGSRPGGIVAACWAALMYIGEEGYVENTRKIINTARTIEKGLREIPNIKVMGQPCMSVIAFGTDDFNVYRLSEALTEKGWNLNALQLPPCIHICTTMMHTYDNVVDNLLNDIRVCTEEIMKTPNAVVGGMGAVYGMAQSIPDRNLVSEMVNLFLDAVYITPFTIKTKNRKLKSNDQ